MIFRAARHTNDLQALIEFYTNIIGLEKLGQFDKHENYSGVFLGKKGENWHLEFTQSNDEAQHSSDEDDILVFYPKEQVEYDAILKRIVENELELLKPQNPYWASNGVMILDPDGFRVVVSWVYCKKD